MSDTGDIYAQTAASRPDYRMDIGPDTRMVTNPARVTARK